MQQFLSAGSLAVGFHGIHGMTIETVAGSHLRPGDAAGWAPRGSGSGVSSADRRDCGGTCWMIILSNI